MDGHAILTAALAVIYSGDFRSPASNGAKLIILYSDDLRFLSYIGPQHLLF